MPTSTGCRAEVYKRIDGKWAWRLLGNNGKIIATDGSQGYNDKAVATSMATRVKSGEYKDCPIEEPDDE